VLSAGKWFAAVSLLGLIAGAASRGELHFRMMLGIAVLAGFIVPWWSW
jgi:hypothetical protein